MQSTQARVKEPIFEMAVDQNLALNSSNLEIIRNSDCSEYDGSSSA